MKVWMLSYLIANLFVSQLMATTIRLVDRITIQGPEVELGEISTIEGGDPNTHSLIKEIVVAEAPSLGNTKVISAYSISNILSNNGFSNVEVLGSQSTVNTESKLVHAEELKDLIEQWLSKELPENIDYKIEYTRLPSRWKVPNISDLDFMVSTSKKQLRKSINLKIRALYDGNILATQSVRINLKIYKDAAVICAPIQNGDILEKKHIRIEKTDITNSNGTEIANLKQIIGMQATRNLKQGDLVTLNHVAAPIVIEKGSFNRLIVMNGSVRMVVAGAKALENGRTGESITFSNPLNKRETLHAKVMRHGIAMIKMK
jgi:flagella basal body P-ring formation protein FlgA